MFVVSLLVAALFVTVQCQVLILPQQQDDRKMIQCVVNILKKYYNESKDLTYVDMNPNNQELLKVIHSLDFSLINRESTYPMLVTHQGYLVFSPDVETFTDNFEGLIREPYWNPYARFLIIIENLRDEELRKIFDVILKQHVNDVILMNGTDEAHLYTYNPFDKYACGRYYDNVISYGQCLQATNDLYPNKLVTGLKKCTFRASAQHRLPFTINPTLNEYRNKIPGMEQYVLTTVSEKEGFKVNFFYNYYTLTFATVAPNMTATGAMSMLQTNETDVLFSALMMTGTRVAAFTHLGGYHEFGEELRFTVKKASFVPTWKYFYIEFDVLVWFLLLISLIVYSALMIFLLKTKDKGQLILKLLDNLLQHGCDIDSGMTIKCILLMWVWFTYLINAFYQSSLVSLTTNPSKEYQISNEEDLLKYNVRPCISEGLAILIFSESSVKAQEFKKTRVNDDACENITQTLQLVKTNKDIFTIVPTYYYSYNKPDFNDKWGDLMIYYMDQPFMKLIMSYFFYKGFPISSRLRWSVMRMRENGLVNKNLRDQYYMRSIKYNYSQREFETRFVMPWLVFISGCGISTACFLLELMTKFWKRRHCPTTALRKRE